MSAATQLVRHLQAAASYITGVPAESRAAAVNAQLANVKQMISRISGPVEANEVNAALRQHFHVLLTASQQQEIYSLVNAQAATMMARGGSESKTQNWSLDFWRELPATLWHGMGDARVTEVARMYKLFDFLYDSGLRHPCEKTYGAMLAMNYYIMGSFLQDNGQQMYNNLVAIKSQWRSHMTYKAANDHNHGNVVWHWPGVGQVESVQLDSSKFISIFQMIPLRSSNIRSTDTAMSGLRMFGTRRAITPALPAAPSASPPRSGT